MIHSIAARPVDQRDDLSITQVDNIYWKFLPLNGTKITLFSKKTHFGDVSKREYAEELLSSKAVIPGAGSFFVMKFPQSVEQAFLVGATADRKFFKLQMRNSAGHPQFEIAVYK